MNGKWVHALFSLGRRFFFRRSIVIWKFCDKSGVKGYCDAHEESIWLGQNGRCCSLNKTYFSLAFRLIMFSLCLGSKIYIQKVFTLILIDFRFDTEFEWLLSHLRESLRNEFAFSANLVHSLDVGIRLCVYYFCMWLHRVQFDIKRPPHELTECGIQTIK